MKIYQGRNTNTLYKKVLTDILENGEETSPRGKLTKEFSPAITIIDNPLERFQTQYGRGGNPFFLLAEVLQILEGCGNVNWLKHYNKGIEQFSDVGHKDFHGSYGVRLRNWGLDKEGKIFGKEQPILLGNDEESLCDYANKLDQSKLPFDQFFDVYMKLKQDKDTRQAIMTLHIPVLDRYDVKTNDRPCNVTSMFKIRDGKLNLHQVLRSNDVTWGLFPTNVFQWSSIQETVAGWLDLPVGELLFFSDSLHAYVKDYNSDVNEKMLQEKRHYDVYDRFKPEQTKLSYTVFESNLRRIKETEQEFREGLYASSSWIQRNIQGIFWQDTTEMLKIYNLRKQGKIEEAIDNVKNIQKLDFKVSALEFLYRNGNTTIQEYVGNVIRQLELDEETKKYVMNN